MLTEDDKHWMLANLATKANLNQAAREAEQGQLTAIANMDQLATKADLEKLVTRIVAEFRQYFSPDEQRKRNHAAAMRALNLEIEQYGSSSPI